MVVGVPGIILFAEMAGRVAAVSHRPVFDLVRERLGARTALANLVASSFVNFLTLAAEVADEMGRAAGKVHDVRLVQDGPMLGTFGAAFRLHGLIVGPASLGARLGYDRAGVDAPFILKVPVQAMHRHIRYVPWIQVRGVGEGQVHIIGSVTDLDEPEPLR